MKTAARVCFSVSRWLTIFAAALTPLFYLPLTPESIDFPKQHLLALLLTPALLFWIVAGILNVPRRLWIRRTPFDIPVLVFVCVTAVSSAFSSEPLTSVFGDHAAMTFSLFALVEYSILFFLLVQTTASTSRTFHNILLGTWSFLCALFLVRLFAPSFFATLGISMTPFSRFVSHLGVIAAALGVYAQARLLRRGLSFATQTFSFFAVALSLVTLAAIGFREPLILFSIGLAAVLMYAIVHMNQVRTWWAGISLGVLVVSVLFAIIGVPKFLTAEIPGEVALGRAASWSVAVRTIRNTVPDFLFGSGPATFPIAFSAHRPVSLNSTFAWNVRFDHPATTAFEILTTLGLLGAVSFIIFCLLAFGTIIFLWWTSAKLAGGRSASEETKDRLSWGMELWGLACVWVVATCALFLLSFGTGLWATWFTLTAVLSLCAQEFFQEDRMVSLNLKTSPQYSLLISFVFMLFVVGMIALGVVLSRSYTGERAYARGLRHMIRSDTDEAEKAFQQASALWPWRPAYALALSQSRFIRASLASNDAKTDPDRFAQLLNSTIGEARRAATIAPDRVVVWQYLGKLYDQVRALSAPLGASAVDAYLKAVQLEGTNPELHLLLGNAYLASGMRAEARQAYLTANELKPDLLDVYLNLSLLEELDGDIDRAIAVAEKAVQLAPDNPDTLFQWGRLYFNRNQAEDLERAREIFLRVVALRPNYANALYALGVIAERQGKDGEALGWYEKVQQIDPKNTDVLRRVRNLRSVPEPILLPAPEITPSVPEVSGE